MSTTASMGELLRQRAAELGDSIALRFMNPKPGPGCPDGRELSYAAMEALSDRYARGLQSVGLRPGERVLMLAKPSPDFFSLVFGLFKLGAIPVLLDPGMGLKNVLACIEEIAPDAAIAMSVVHAVRQVLRRPFKKTRLFVTVGSRWFWGGPTLHQVHDAGASQEGPFPIGDFAPTDEALIVFTSGSTGPAKGVSLTHQALPTVIENFARALGQQPGMVWMEAFTAFTLVDIGNGMTAVVPRGDLTKPATLDPADVVQAIQDNQCSGAFASPIVWAHTLRHAEEQGLTLPTLQLGVTTGAPIPADMHRRWQRVTGESVELFTPYGATECLGVATISTSEILGETWDLTSKGWGTCVGRPFHNARVRIIAITEDPIPEWSDELQLPTGEIGEIVGDTPVASPEYKQRPQANAESKIRAEDGRVMHRMGDLGYLDEEGRLWFCGRKSHRLETPDGVVPAVPVEGVFNEHPEVFRCALVGLGERGQEVPVLLVELERGKTWSAELEQALEDLAKGTRWEGLVTAFKAHPGFPTDARHNSKIKRGELRAWAAQQSWG